jgi:hypothetical protein
VAGLFAPGLVLALVLVGTPSAQTKNEAGARDNRIKRGSARVRKDATPR